MQGSRDHLRRAREPALALFYKGLTNRYMNLEGEGMKWAAETS